jgi:tRNA modification GTPase
MNMIVGREASIVSGEAGTTRDIVEASLDIRGYLCSFADTAGFRSRDTSAEHIGAVEEEGIRRARKKAQESDMIVVLASVESGPAGPYIHFDKETLALATAAQSSLVIVNKQDAVDEKALVLLLQQFRQLLRDKYPSLPQEPLCISCQDTTRSKSSIHDVVTALVSSFSQMTDMPPDMRDLLGVTERQRQLLVKCRLHLEEFMDEAAGESDIVLAAEYLRYAADCLSRITGKGEAGDVEDVLGVVFEK